MNTNSRSLHGGDEVAVLDDYQSAALQMADWTEVERRAVVTVFRDHLTDPGALVKRLAPFDVICAMRERTPFTRAILQQLPQLKLIVSTGKRNAAIDVSAANERNIKVCGTGYMEQGAPEMTWALILAACKYIPEESAAVRSGGWQTKVTRDLKNHTLGIVGLGNIGRTIARYAQAFEMNVIASSENLKEEDAVKQGVRPVTKEQLFREADIVTVHMVLSYRSRGMVGASEFAVMKPTALFVNTSRGPLVNEAALIRALESGRIAGAALDVFDTEPLPPDHPFRTLENVLATPHTGFVTEDTYRLFYRDTV